VAGLTGEEARNVVTACFTKAIREIHERGGDVLKFAGDALFAAWTASDDVSLGTCVAHAARCASAIHATVSKVGDSNTDNSSSVRLKVCVGAGELHAFNVGGVGGKWEFMCAGEPLAQIAKLMPLANPGQTLVSERAHSIIQSQSTGAHLRTAPAATGGHRLVIDRPRTDSDGIEHDIEHDIEDMIPPTSTPEAIVRLHAPNNVSVTKLSEWRRAVAAATAGYVPHPAADGAADTAHHWLGEIRRCSVAFVCFEGVNYERPDALPRLQRAATTMQRALRRAAGASRQMLVDEKGSALVAVFGLEVGGGSNRSATCACDATLAAMEMRRELRGAGLGTKCGEFILSPLVWAIRLTSCFVCRGEHR
jgi:class 3 adenylate cyclase